VHRQTGVACDIGAYEHSPCGDANGDGAVNVSDVFFLINFLFAGGAAPSCPGRDTARVDRHCGLYSAAPIPMPLAAGTPLGSYRVTALLGAGGMGEVYRAHDVNLGRDVAIKVLPESVATDPEALARFEREARAIAALSHPNIRGIFDLVRDGEVVFAVMELLEGEPLRGRLLDGPLPQKMALDYALQAARGLSAAHEKGIVHRDVKPENLFVTSDGYVKILDFGLVKQQVAPVTKDDTSAPTASVSPGHRASETEPGVVLGTLDYMSPEQVKGRPVDHRSDVFSLGAVLHEMLTGEKAFHRETVAETMAAIMRDEPSARAALAPELVELVGHCLEKKPEDRFQTAKDLAFALMQAASGVLASRPVAAPVPATSAATPAPRRKAFLMAGLGLAVAVLAVLLVARSGVGRRGSRAGDGAATPGVIRSIAVLPLDNYSGDPGQDYFAEGMTDELTTDLATISGLRVISRGSATQFKGKRRPPAPEIAKLLDVDAVVEGSVMRAGDRVRITAQLIDARADKHLWAKSFERSSRDVLALQDELASAIAREIHVQLTPTEKARLSNAPTLNPEAHDAYLKGRYFFNRPSDENLKKSIVEFEEAVRLSPDFAPAYSGLSDAYLWAGYNEGVLTSSQAKPKAKAAAERAIQLDDGSAEAHTSFADFKLWYEFDWAGCEREFRRAFALNPSYAFAHDQFGLGLAFQGRLDEAIAEGKRAAELDPLSPQIPLDNSIALMFQGSYEAAKAQARRASQLDPAYFFPDFADGWIDIDAKKFREAIPSLKKAKANESPAFVTAWLSHAYGSSGDRAQALKELEDLKRMSAGGHVLPFNMAVVSLGLGDRTAALDYLEKAHAADSQWLCWLKMDRMFDPLRSEPRFAALLKKLGFDR
jgi:TolB-like protein